MDRCENIKIGKKFNPILIFPEGTTTNGDYIVSYKKGPFVNRAPLKMLVLKFNSQVFNSFLDEINMGVLVLLTMSRLR